MLQRASQAYEAAAANRGRAHVYTPSGVLNTRPVANLGPDVMERDPALLLEQTGRVVQAYPRDGGELRKHRAGFE